MRDTILKYFSYVPGVFLCNSPNWTYSYNIIQYFSVVYFNHDNENISAIDIIVIFILGNKELSPKYFGERYHFEIF